MMIATMTGTIVTITVRMNRCITNRIQRWKEQGTDDHTHTLLIQVLSLSSTGSLTTTQADGHYRGWSWDWAANHV